MENQLDPGSRKANGGGKENCRTTRTAKNDSRRGSKKTRGKSANGHKARSPGARKGGKTVAASRQTGQDLDKDRPHHPYSPSWLQSGEACALYRSKDSNHVRTIAGTIAHKAAERQEDDDRLSDDDAVAVAECLDFYDTRKQQLEKNARQKYAAAIVAWDALNCSSATNSSPPTPDDFRITEGTETYLPIDDLKFPDCEATTAGYVDRWLLNATKDYAEIIDWKFGKWPVEEAVNNLQGMAYAMGIFRMFPTVKNVCVFFKQPLISYLTSHTFSREDLAEIYLRIQTIVERARLARARAEQGDWSDAKPAYPLCNFCANIGKCEKVLAFACKVGHKFHPLGIPAEVNPSLVQDPANTKLAMELANVLKVWGDAFRRQVTDRVIRGDAAMPDGYETQSMQKRELVDMEKYKILALRYLSSQEWEACLDTTFGDVEKKIALKAPRGSKETTVKEFQALAAQEGATKLGAPISFLKVKSEKSNKQSN